MDMQAKASERADQTYQATRDARRANKVGRVEDQGQRWLPIWRGGDGLEARLEAARRGQEERLSGSTSAVTTETAIAFGMGLSNSVKKCRKGK